MKHGKNTKVPKPKIAAKQKASKARKGKTIKEINGKYKITDHSIGEGTTSVMLGYQLDPLKEVAIKIMDLASLAEEEGGTERLKKELKISAMLKHRNIVRFDGFEEVGKDMGYIIYELLKGEDLSEYLSHYGNISDTHASVILYQALLGLEEAHKQGVVHRDIKMENLMIQEDPTHPSGVRVLFIDWGFAEERSSCAEVIRGSIYYISPELLRKSIEDPWAGDTKLSTFDLYLAADLWSMGVLLYALLVGDFPFGSSTEFELCEDEDEFNAMIFRSIMYAEYQLPKGMSAPAADLINALLNPRPEERIKLSQVMKHEYFAVAKSIEDGAKKIKIDSGDMRLTGKKKRLVAPRLGKRWAEKLRLAPKPYQTTGDASLDNLAKFLSRAELSSDPTATL